jgi:hypothetical protein
MDKAYLKERLYQYGLLMRMDKPIGTLLLLWPTLWALWIAGAGHPDARVVVIFMLGVFLMRSAGCGSEKSVGEGGSGAVRLALSGSPRTCADDE